MNARLKCNVTNYLDILGGVCSSHFPVLWFRARNFGKNRTGPTSPRRKNRSPTNRHRHGLRPISDLLDYDLSISLAFAHRRTLRTWYEAWSVRLTHVVVRQKRDFIQEEELLVSGVVTVTIKQNPAVSRSLDRRPKERGTRLCSEARLAHRACLSSMIFSRASSFHSLVRFFFSFFLSDGLWLAWIIDNVCGIDRRHSWSFWQAGQAQPQPSRQDLRFVTRRPLTYARPSRRGNSNNSLLWISRLRSIITNRRTLTYTRHYYTWVILSKV